MRLTRALGGSAAVLAATALLVAGGAFSHPERTTAFPTLADAKAGSVPVYRTRGPSVVVCKADSRARINRIYKGRGRKNTRLRHKRLAVLKRCAYHDIQAAINAAKSGYRVLIMPGVYKEEPSRAVAFGGYHQPPCANDYVVTEGFNTAGLPPPVGPASNDPPVRADRNYTIKCPNSKNLIAVVGDPTPEKNPAHPGPPKCVQLCNLQIEGLGKRPEDVLIVADRVKLDGLRIDRADGIYLRNFAVEQAAFNDIDLVEVNGFRISRVVTRYAQDYGVLSFTAVNGLYDHDVAYGNGDSGLYPGSTMKGCDVDGNVYGTCAKTGCQRSSIEIRDSESYGNTLGYSGTAGNSTWVHDNDFHDNASGLATDSFASGHPGMPQECFKWEHNQIHSNNFNPFTDARQSYCTATPFAKREREIVCPQFQTPVGTGVVIGGGNRDLLRENRIYDNWRWGALLLTVPAVIRGDNDPAHQTDTSNGNRFIANTMGERPDGTADPNGVDFMWDSLGAANCWSGNTSKSGAGRASSPSILPGCPNTGPVLPLNIAAVIAALPCAAWDPRTNHMPIGCDWFVTPREPLR